MPNEAHCPVPQRPSLNYHMYHQSKTPDNLRHLIRDLSRAAKYISYAIQTTEMGLAGSKNRYGEDQLKLDVYSDEIIRDNLCESGLVSCFASEEQADVIEMDSDAPFTVVFDPLDGSSLVDANFAIGSIFGIFEGKDIVGRTPRELVAALYVLYGPRTLLVYSTGEGVHEFILNDVGEFIMLRQHLGVADDAKNFSPGNLQALNDNPEYKTMISTWMEEGKKLRYSGALVADVHHILSKGQGIFTYVGSRTKPEGKLRHVFECGPFAYLMDQAGGMASDGTQHILDKKIESIDQRTPFIVGSKNEVERTVQMLAS